MNINQQIEMLESKIDLIKLEIEDKQGEITTIQSNIETFEYICTDDEYNEYLDNVFDEVEIMGMTYNISYALKELDPIAYRCDKADYEANIDLDDVEEYQELQNQLDELESQLDDLQNQLDELQDQLDELESED